MYRSSQQYIGSGRTADEWFTVLDQRWINARGGQWITQVQGIHSTGPDHWIQIASVEQADRSLVLHVSARTTLSAAVEALVAGPLPEPAGGAIVDVQEAA